MTFQTKPVEIEEEIDFPDSGADKATRAMANGYAINYIDSKNEPASTFVYGKSWDSCLEEFEQKYEYTIIIYHFPAYMGYDF